MASAIDIANDLFKKFKAGAGDVVNYVKQNPYSTPASYVAQKAAPTFNYIRNKVEPLEQYKRTYAKNRYIDPVVNLPKNIKETFRTDKPLLTTDRGAAALGTLGGIGTLFPDPIGDVAMPLFDLYKGYRASAIRGGGLKENIKSGLQSLSLEKPVGFGTAMTTDPTKELVGNVAELPLTFLAVGKLAKTKLNTKNILDNEININRARLFIKNWKKAPTVDRFMLIESVAKKIIPEVMNNKEVKKILHKPYGKEEYLKIIDTFLYDKLLQAKHPEFNFGQSVRPIKREAQFSPSTGGEIPRILYRGVKKGYPNQGSTQGSWLTSDYATAQKYAGEGGKVLELPLTPELQAKLQTPGFRIENGVRQYQGRLGVSDALRLLKEQPSSVGEIPKGVPSIGGEIGGKYKLKKPELKGKLSSEDALIQSGLDSGWNSLLKSGETDIKKLTSTEREYLRKSATSYYLAGDPVIKERANLYSLDSGGEIPKGTTPKIETPVKNPTTVEYLEELKKQQQQARQGDKGKGLLRTAISEIKRKFVDKFSPIEDALTEAEKQGKFKVLPKDDIRLQLDRVVRSNSMAGQFAKDNGLTEVIQDVPDIDALDQYMIAKHAQTIEGTGRKTGRNLEMDKQLVNDLASTYEPFAQQVTTYSRKLLDYLTERGLISKELSSKLKAMYPDYVPLQRIMDDTGYFGTTQKPVASVPNQSVIKRLKGSERTIESPLVSLLSMTNKAFSQGERNMAARMLTSYRNLPGFKDLIKKVGNEAYTTITHVADDGTIEYRKVLKPSFLQDKNVITVYENGKKMAYETTPEIAAAAKSLNQEQLGFVMKMLNFPTRILRLGATGVNIPFVVSNIIKDQLTGFINSNRTAKTSLLNPVNFMKALFSAAKHDELYDELVRVGAGGTSYDIGRVPNMATLKQIRAGKNLKSKIAYTIVRPGEMLRVLEDLVGRSEEVGRLQQYRGTKNALLSEGRTIQDATLLGSEAARKNTANFLRSGEWGKVLNYIIPYFNAGIQGARSTVEALQTRPLQTTSKIAVGLLTPIAAATLWNLSDKKRKAVYDDIDDYEKEGNIVVVLDPDAPIEKGRYTGVIKIPIQQGFGALGTTLRRGLEQAYGLSPVKMGEVASSLIQFGTSLNVGSTRELVSDFTPQGLKIPIEASTNTNLFTGKQIIPQYMMDRPPEEQVYPWTSGTTRLIGRALNQSPLMVQNAVNTGMGGVGRQVLNASDKALSAAGIIPKSQIGGEGVAEATSKRFVSVSAGKQMEEAYKDKAKSDAARKKAIGLWAENKKDEALALKREYNFSVDKKDVDTFKKNKIKSIANLFVEYKLTNDRGKFQQAMDIKKQYNLQPSKLDVQKAAKSKAVELMKLYNASGKKNKTLLEQAIKLKNEYSLVITREEVE